MQVSVPIQERDQGQFDHVYLAEAIPVAASPSHLTGIIGRSGPLTWTLVDYRFWPKKNGPSVTFGSTRNIAACFLTPRTARLHRRIFGARSPGRASYGRCNERDPHRVLWVLALAIGLRRGELLGLRWQDLDLDAGQLTVKQALVMLKGKSVIQAPKSKAAVRSV